MPTEVILPKVDMDMASGTIADWHKTEGEAVEAGDALFDIETDKATMEVESPASGILHFVSAKQGDEIPIGQVIAWIFSEGEDVVAPNGSANAQLKDPAPEPLSSPPNAVETARTEDKTVSNGTRATPLARRLAKSLGIALSDVVGSGPRGRITRLDIKTASQAAPAVTSNAGAHAAGRKTGAEQIAKDLGLSYTTVPVSKMRSVIATRLTEAKNTVPHFYLNADVEIDALLTMRAQMNAVLSETDAKKISVNDLLIKACAAALKAVPEANASWDGERIVKYGEAHISVAVSIEGGLVTPVVRSAQNKDIQTISAEIADLAARAKAGKLPSSAYQGGSFSLSNLGMFGVKSFNAIINPPESMILAVGQGTRQFVPDTTGDPKVATVMSVSLSCDHRVVDGALGAMWLQKFKALVENPASMLLR
ncbi:MAG: dihydrolipoamide acetyltransferase family protein [Pseudomonadota bacterium]